MKVPFTTLALAVVMTGGATTVSLAGFDANMRVSGLDETTVAATMTPGLTHHASLGDADENQADWQVAQVTTPLTGTGSSSESSEDFGSGSGSGSGGDASGSGGSGSSGSSGDSGSSGGEGAGSGGGSGDSLSFEMAPSDYVTGGLGSDIEFG